MTVSDDGGEEDSRLSVSYDAGWSTRGSSRQYNSDTGHSVLIGKETGKCVAFAVKSRRCRQCEVAEKENRPVMAHECYRNWTGSSKAMEPAMAVDMIGEIKSQDCDVKSLTMDNDSTTIARVQAVHGDINKLSDTNHTKKSIVNSLYKLNEQHKELRNNKTINYISKMIMYAIHQKQGDITGLQTRLDQVVPHMFGDHSKCDAVWCGHLKDPTKFSYKSLPFKRAFSNLALKSDLEKLVSQYRAKAEKLAYLGSSQANEAFNTTVASKAPKSR